MWWYEDMDGFHCVDCLEKLDLIELERTIREEKPHCNDCEFDHLTPPDWFEDFLAKLWLWRFRPAEEDLGYN
jgi:NAD-dependent SIR2 family protein deacetylase